MCVVCVCVVWQWTLVPVRVFEPELEKDESLPVMIYIHGGGFTLGTGKDFAMNYVAT